MINPIGEITKSQIANMINDISLTLYKSQKIRLSSLIYEEFRAVLTDHLDYLLRKLNPYSRYLKNKLVTEHHVLQVLNFVPGMIPHLKQCPTHKINKVKSEINKQYKTIVKQVNKLETRLQKLYDKNRADPENSDIIEEINELYEKVSKLKEEKADLYDTYYAPIEEQKQEVKQLLKDQDSCFYFSQNTFHKLIDFLNRDYLYSYTDDAYLLMQFETEYYLKELFTHSIKLVYHRKKDTLIPRDVQSARAAMNQYDYYLNRPRFVYPDVENSFRDEYIHIRDTQGIKEKKVDQNVITQMDYFNHMLVEKLIQYAYVFSHLEKQPNITMKSLRSAVEVVLPGQLSIHTISYIRNDDNSNTHNTDNVYFDTKQNIQISEEISDTISRIVEYISAEMIDLMGGLHSTVKFFSIFEEDEEFLSLKDSLGFVPIKIT